MPENGWHYYCTTFIYGKKSQQQMQRISKLLKVIPKNTELIFKTVCVVNLCREMRPRCIVIRD